MAFAAFFARFALCVSALFARTVVSETVASSPANSLLDVLQSGCNWECNVVGSEFGLEMKALISEYRLITLHLKYEQQVEKKCSNQTDANNSSIKLAELWTWFSGHGNPSHGGQNMSQPSSSNKDSGTWFRKSLEGQIEVGVLCSLQPTKDLNGTQPSLNDLITMELMEEVANFAPEHSYSDTVLCYKLSAKNGSFVCVNKTTNIAAGNIYLNWQENGFRILEVLISIVTFMYGPAIICLFTPTEVKTKEGRVNIVLHGTSPVGIRSWIANSFSSHADSIKWKLLQTSLILFICIGSIIVEWKILDLVLPHAAILQTLQNTLHLVTLYPLLLVFTCLLTIRAFVRIFWTSLSFQKPCLICDSFGDKENIRHDQEHQNSYGWEEMKMHLRLQPSVVFRCCKGSWDSFLSCLGYVIGYFYGLWPPLSVFLCLLSMLIAPFAIVACLVAIIIVLFHSCPLSTLYDMLIYRSRTYRKTNKSFVVAAVGYYQVTVYVWTSFYFIVEMVINLATIIKGILMQLPDFLPYASLVVVIAYYLWKCYSTFTRKYDNLAFKLYEHYKTKPEARNNEPVCPIDDSTRVIPKDLFDGACEKIIPVGVSIGKLVVTSILILAGIFFLYFAVIMKTPGANDTTQAIGTLLTTLIPQIVEMMFGKDQEMMKLEDTIFNERVGSVVDKYVAKLNASNNNNRGTSTENEEENGQPGLSNETTPLLPGYGTFAERSENTTAAQSPSSISTTNV